MGRITGGTRGIGAKIALALSKAGADLILVQRNTSNTQTKEAIEAAGGKADIVVADLADKASVEKLIPHVTKELGRTLDIVVNCGALDVAPVPPADRVRADPQEVSSDDTRWRTSQTTTGRRSSR